MTARTNIPTAEELIDRFSKYLVGRWLRPRLFFSLSAFFGLTLLFIFYYSELYNHYRAGSAWASVYLVREIGLSLIVAALLGAFVEAYNQRRHQHHVDALTLELDRQHLANTTSLVSAIKKNTLQAVYGNSLGKAIVDSAASQILEARFKRKRWRIHFNVSPLEGELAEQYPRAVKLTICMIGDLYNITSQEQLLSSSFEIDSDYPQETIKIDSFQVGLLELIGNKVIREHEGFSSRPKCVLISYSLCVPPSGRVAFKAKYSYISGVADSEVLVSKFPTDAMTVFLQCTSCNAEFSISELHLKKALRSDDIVEGQKWTLKGVLPMQGMIVSWTT